MNSNSSGALGKSICSICYEDLNPILEDLQAISICGHVFHELWFLFSLSLLHFTAPLSIFQSFLLSYICFVFCLSPNSSAFSNGWSTALQARKAAALYASSSALRRTSVDSISSRWGTHLHRPPFLLRNHRMPMPRHVLSLKTSIHLHWVEPRFLFMTLVLLCVSLLQALRQEVKKLEMKFSGLNSAFEDQQQRLKELSSEVMYFSFLAFHLFGSIWSG